MAVHQRFRGLLAAACLLLVACLRLPDAVHATKPTHSEAEQQASLRELFRVLDANADEQLDAEELASAAATSLDMREEGWSASEATRSAQLALDGPDLGTGVSATELQHHLRALLQASCRWPFCTYSMFEDVVPAGQQHPHPAAAFVPGCSGGGGRAGAGRLRC